jgi:AcrR family transcriptional regulator
MNTESSRARRGEATRATILAVARERFASDGYERATIRAIAADAGIDPTVVMRYYGSKDGLFAATATFDLRMPNLKTVPRRSIGRVLIEHFLARWEDDDTLKALLRTAATNETAAGRMRAIFAEQVEPALMAGCRDSKTASTRAGLVSSQVMGFAFTRYILKLPPIATMSRADAVRWLAPTVQRYLLTPSSAPP